MSWVLVTNDDGVDSPALVPFVRALRTITEVRVVVPDRERSWVGKAITRHDPVHVEEVERDGIVIHTASGYPADCTQLGLHTLFDDQPDLVVSGINLGFNIGSGYLQSSGTVGAALEAWIAGVPGLAFSAGTNRGWEWWRGWVETAEAVPMWERLSALAAAMTGAALGTGRARTLVSINMPEEADVGTPRRVTTVADVGYQRLFGRNEAGDYVHDYGGGLIRYAALDGTDVEAVRGGVVSITAIRAAEGGVLLAPLETALIG